MYLDGVYTDSFTLKPQFFQLHINRYPAYRLCMYVYSELHRQNKCRGQTASAFWSWYFVSVRIYIMYPILEAFTCPPISWGYDFIILAGIAAGSTHSSAVMLVRTEHNGCTCKNFRTSLRPTSLAWTVFKACWIYLTVASPCNKCRNMASRLELRSAICDPCNTSMRPATLLGI
jgi:hypothetical protein